METIGNVRLKMDQFLASVERRAFRMALFATNDSEDSLDIVQDAMLGLVQKYHSKPEQMWKPLFYRILQNRIRDWYRRGSVRNRFRAWLTNRMQSDSDVPEDPMESIADANGKNPADMAQIGDASKALKVALKSLPLRQQQAFLLRAWEGLSVAETAGAMCCSEGSVKTHYSRAVHTLRKMLEDHWP